MGNDFIVILLNMIKIPFVLNYFLVSVFVVVVVIFFCKGKQQRYSYILVVVITVLGVALVHTGFFTQKSILTGICNKCLVYGHREVDLDLLGGTFTKVK